MGKSPSLKVAEAPVREALILICEKCGKKLSDSDDGDKNPSRRLQKDLKEEIGKLFGKYTARAVVTSCINICPKNEIAISFSPVKGPSEFFTFELNEIDSVKAELMNRIIELAKK